jgi:uncharacterized metal-binding protein YceD (DUF177 family)
MQFTIFYFTTPGNDDFTFECARVLRRVAKELQYHVTSRHIPEGSHLDDLLPDKTVSTTLT